VSLSHVQLPSLFAVPWIKDSEKIRYGDKLLFSVYCRRFELEVDQSVEIFPVCSILNYQRQYVACKNESLEQVLQNELLGKRKDSEITARRAAPVESLDIDIPPLNVVQEKAADNFLCASDQMIHIVQGYVCR
jgi:hypothetical protein